MNNTNRIWRIRQSTEPKTLDVYIYGYVEGDSEDVTTGEKIKSKTSADYFKEELEKHPDVTNINLYVNSWGGDVYEGTAIRTLLKRYPAYVTGYVDGFACSIASYILTACDKVVMPRNTMQFIHNIWCVSIGDANHHRKTADDLEQLMKANRQAYLEKTNGKLTEKKLIELLNAETWLTADECKAYGLCDVVLSKEADLSEAKQILQKVKKNHEQELRQNKKLAAQVDALIGGSSKAGSNKIMKFLLSLIEQFKPDKSQSCSSHKSEPNKTMSFLTSVFERINPGNSQLKGLESELNELKNTVLSAIRERRR